MSNRLILGTVAFIMALFSFSMLYISLTPVYDTLATAFNNTATAQGLSGDILVIWSRTLSVYTSAWQVWGVFGVLCLILWLWTYLQQEDAYSYGGIR